MDDFVAIEENILTDRILIRTKDPDPITDPGPGGNLITDRPYSDPQHCVRSERMPFSFSLLLVDDI
jgi:hypothetical protein